MKRAGIVVATLAIPVAVVLALAFGLASCGDDGTAGPTPTKTVTVTATPSASPSPSPSPTGTMTVSTYLMRGETLGVAHREVPASVAVAKAAMTALLEGPNAREKAAGLTTTIPAGTTLNEVTIEDGTARVGPERRLRERWRFALDAGTGRPGRLYAHAVQDGQSRRLLDRRRARRDARGRRARPERRTDPRRLGGDAAGDLRRDAGRRRRHHRLSPRRPRQRLRVRGDLRGRSPRRRRCDRRRQDGDRHRGRPGARRLRGAPRPAADERQGQAGRLRGLDGGRLAHERGEDPAALRRRGTEGGREDGWRGLRESHPPAWV